MRLSTFLALAALGLTASALPAAAGTLLVPSKAYPTIQSALNAAKPYDTVQVSAKPNGGVYSEAVLISTPHVTLQGKGGPVIDGSKLGKVIYFLPGFPQFFYTLFPNGVEVRADHVAVCGMTVQGFAGSLQEGTGIGIAVFGSKTAGPSDILLSGNTLRKNGEGLEIDGYTGSNPLFYGGGTYTKGFQILGNTLTANSGDGALINGASVLVAGNKATGNGGNGLEAAGIGVTLSGNESGGNTSDGLDVTDAAYTYDPSVNDPQYPNPAPTTTAFNYVHDNSYVGILANGTQTITGNLLANNGSYGLDLEYADFSAVLGNEISGSGNTGLYAGDGVAFFGGNNGLKVSLNQISGNAGDGIYFANYAGGVISLNNVTGNQDIGIHLSDNATLFTYYGNSGAPTTVTQNRALHNALFDARDDASAPDDLYYNYEDYYGDDNAYGPTVNVWTKNVFGTTDPVGLSK